jgi:hypothetical protein
MTSFFWRENKADEAKQAWGCELKANAVVAPKKQKKPLARDEKP